MSETEVAMMKLLLLAVSALWGVRVQAAETVTNLTQIDWGPGMKPLAWAAEPGRVADGLPGDEGEAQGGKVRESRASGPYAAEVTYGQSASAESGTVDRRGSSGLRPGADGVELEAPAALASTVVGLGPGAAIFGSNSAVESPTAADAEDGRWDREAAHLEAIPVHEVATGLGYALSEQARVGLAYRYIGADAEWDRKGSSPWSAPPLLVEKEQNHGAVLSFELRF